MELTSQVLRQVEFGSELRGYKTSEVDDFLEKAAVSLDALHQEVAELRERAERAERAQREAGDRSGEDEDSIRRTLVLAQRTADMVIKESRDEASKLLDGARAEAEGVLADARQAAERLRAEADRMLRDEVEAMAADKEHLRSEVDTLVELLAAERERLTESLTTALQFVEKNLVPSPGVAAASSRGGSPTGAERRAEAPFLAGSVGSVGSASSPSSAATFDVGELEAAIAADAAAAAPAAAAPAPEVESTVSREDGASQLTRPNLTALPPLEDDLDNEGADHGDTEGASFGPEGAPARGGWDTQADG